VKAYVALSVVREVKKSNEVAAGMGKKADA
jgi:hypothetical protein